MASYIPNSLYRPSLKTLNFNIMTIRNDPQTTLTNDHANNPTNYPTPAAAPSNQGNNKVKPKPRGQLLSKRGSPNLN